jgi:hypothetical protein
VFFFYNLINGGNMLLKIGYLLRGSSRKIREIIAVTISLFADSIDYTADTTNVLASNDSNIT